MDAPAAPTVPSAPGAHAGSGCLRRWRPSTSALHPRWHIMSGVGKPAIGGSPSYGALVALFGGVIALGGFLVRQWTKLMNRRITYLKTLSETLYVRTLADGPGVLHTLLSSAEQQEVIEVILAYRFLLDAPGGLSRDDEVVPDLVEVRWRSPA
jgi:hypothetical protein